MAAKTDAKLGNEDTELTHQLVNGLKEKLRQYQEAMQGMAEHKLELTRMLSRQQEDQKDIFDYLKAELVKKTDEVRDLERRAAGLVEANGRQTREHAARLEAHDDAAQEEWGRLNVTIRDQKETLGRVHHFQELQESIEAEMEAQKQQLAEETRRHTSEVSDLERKHVQEKDRLKKEMLLKLRETKANLLKMTDNQLDTTTKRTVAENEQMSSELAWQSKETEKLIDKNDKLTAANQGLKRELSIHDQTTKDLAGKVRPLVAHLARVDNMLRRSGGQTLTRHDGVRKCRVVSSRCHTYIFDI